MESRAKFAKLDKDAEISELPRDRHDRNDPAAILPPNDNDLFSQFGMAWMAITPQGNILDCNDFCLKLLGESLDVLKKSSIDDFIAPEFLDRVRERRKRRIRGEQVPNNHECRLKLASGTELWVRVRTSLLEGQEKTGGMMVILTDITDQKLAEAALHNKEQEYARLFASSQTGYVVSDADARILECNDLFLDFLGQNRDSLGTLSLWDFLAPECMADAKKRNALYLLGHEESLDYEIHCLRPDGSDVWLQVHSVPQYRDGELSVVESLMWDETDARNAQLEHTKESARAQKAADTLNAIFRSLPANVLLLDKTGSIVSMSDSWQELSSQQGQAILLDFKIGDNILELCDLAIGPGDENARLLSEGIRGILSLQQPRFDYRGNYFLAGEQRWYDMAVTPLIPGKREGAVLLCYETTRQHQEREALRTAQLHLQEVVNSTGGILWEADPKTFRFTYVSEAAERILGYPVSMWTDDVEFWASHIHEDDRQSAVRYCMEHTARGENHRFRYRMIAADGQVVWMEDVVTVISRDGKPESLRGVMVDVSAEVAQQETLSQISTTLDLSFSEIYIFDSDSLKFKYINNGALSNLGFSSRQMLRMTPIDIKPDYEENSFRKLLEPLKKGEVPKLVFTTKHLRADGSTYPCEVHLHHTKHQSKDSFLAVALDISERRDQEEFHQLLLENVISGLLLVDIEGGITLANRYIHEMFGFDQGELVGKPIETLVPMKSRKEHVALRNEYVKDLKPIHMGSREGLLGLRKDGTEFPVDIEISQTTISGKPFLLVCVSDLTDRLAIEEKAAKSLEKYERVVEHMHDALLVDDLEGRVVYCNDRFLEYFGLERKDVENLTMDDYIAPEHLERMRQSHARRVTSESAAEIQEFEGVRKDGSRLHLQARTTPVFKKGELFGTQSILLDITESKIVEEELRRAQMHIEELIDGTEGIVWESKPGSMRFSYISKQAERLLGYPVERWLNEPNFWRDHIHPYDRSMVVREYGKEGQQDSSHRIEYRMIAADDSIVWLDDQVSVIYQDGEPVVLRGIMVDITERKTLMEALRNLSQREGALVENERRRIAQELHDDYSQRMALVALRLQTLGRELPESFSHQQQTLEELWSDTKLLSTDLHNLAYELAPTSLRQMGLQGAISNLCDKYYKHHSLPVDFVFSNLPKLLSETKAIALYRIVQEALNNVRKHSNSDDATVQLTGVDGNLELIISDSGEGFDTTRNAHTHNLGLMGMAERAYMVGGTWSVTSHPDKGTTIKVVIPLPASPASETPENPQTETTGHDEK